MPPAGHDADIDCTCSYPVPQAALSAGMPAIEAFRKAQLQGDFTLAANQRVCPRQRGVEAGQVWGAIRG